MKIRAENLIAAVGELRIGLLAVRHLADTLLSLIEGSRHLTIVETGFRTWFGVHASRLPRSKAHRRGACRLRDGNRHRADDRQRKRAELIRPFPCH